MKLKKIYIQFQSVLILLLMPVLYKADYSYIAFILYMAITAVYLLYMFKTDSGLNLNIFIYGGLVSAWMAFELILFDFQGVLRIIQYVCLLLTIIVNSRIKWDNEDYVFLQKTARKVIILAVIWIPVSGFQLSRYAAYYSHSNYLGSMMFHIGIILALVHYLDKTQKKGRFVLEETVVFFIAAISNSRSAIFALIIFWGLLFVFKTGKKKHTKQSYKFNAAIFGAIIFAVAVTVIYPRLVNTSLGLSIEMISRKYLSKNFFSGRHILWDRILKLTAESPIIGYGLSATPGMYIDTSFSSHNLWLQIMLQTGITGLLLFVLFLFAVIKKIKVSRSDKIGIAYICALIFHECFEVTLTQNEFSTGIIAWIIFGIMMTKSLSKT